MRARAVVLGLALGLGLAAAAPAQEAGLTLAAGDTVIVHGNAKKTLQFITSLAGFGGFLNYLRIGRRY